MHDVRVAFGWTVQIKPIVAGRWPYAHHQQSRLHLRWLRLMADDMSSRIFLLSLRRQTQQAPHGNLRAPKQQVSQKKGELLNQFRQNRKHRASNGGSKDALKPDLTTGGKSAATSPPDASESIGGEYVSEGKQVQPPPSLPEALATQQQREHQVFRTSRLTDVEMQTRVIEMQAQLDRVAEGTLVMKQKTIERYHKFIKRYKELEVELGNMKAEEIEGEDDQSESLVGPPVGGGVAAAAAAETKAVESRFTHNKTSRKHQHKHAQEFKETKELVMGRTSQQRESVADKMRNEIADHEAGLKKMDEEVYLEKKKALARFDRINGKKNGLTAEGGVEASVSAVGGNGVVAEGDASKSLEEPVVKSKSSGVGGDDKPTVESHEEVSEGTFANGEVAETTEAQNDDAAEEAVSEGKTMETDDPETMEAPPRDATNTPLREDNTPNIIVHGEKVVLRDEDGAARATHEEKELYRKEYATKEKATIISDNVLPDDVEVHTVTHLHSERYGNAP